MQRPVAGAPAGNGGDPVLHVLDVPADGSAAGVQAHGVLGGEPADGTGEIGAGHQLLVAAVGFEVDQERGVRADGVDEGCQEQFVGPGVEGGGGRGEQRGCDLRREFGTQLRRGVRGVGRIPGSEGRGRVLDHGRPVVPFGGEALGVPVQGARPVGEGSGGAGRGCSGGDGVGEVGEQDAPGDAVDSEVVDEQQQPTVPAGPGVNHTARSN